MDMVSPDMTRSDKTKSNITQKNINQPNIAQPNINQPNINQPNLIKANLIRPNLIKIDAYRWKLPRSGAMNVPGIIYASDSLLENIKDEEALTQVANVASLPGIVKCSLAMPDIHWEYGFPIGGVAAFDCDSGIISPGGVGYDINCGVRLATTSLTQKDIIAHQEKIANALYHAIPSGVGSTGPINLSVKEEKKMLSQGSAWAVARGYGSASDIERTEEKGKMPEADPDQASKRALERGRAQLGTLGSGNHFLEIGVVDEIFHPKAARAFGLFKDQITIMLHTGSRGFGYQICDDFLRVMAQRHSKKKEFNLPDRQLACAPVNSQAGRRYFRAMACAANYAWANRQILMHTAGETMMRALGISPRDFGMKTLYDVSHNIARNEDHLIDGKSRRLCVHRKGATRAFPPGHKSLCDELRPVGQPILTPGDMGTASYVLVGAKKAMEETFGSTCHGAGRVLSRKAAKKAVRGRDLQKELEKKGIMVRWTGRFTLAEEMPEAYKDISQVANVAHESGISKKVARIRPFIVIKG